MAGLVLFAAFLAPAAPVPAPVPGVVPPRPNPSKVDPNQVTHFANLVENLSFTVCDLYVRRSITPKELLEGAVRGLYDEVGLPVPDAVLKQVRETRTQIDRLQAMREIRTALGDHPKLVGSRSLFAAMNGFKYATDPICVLTSPRVNSYASIDQDFGIGVELDGVVGTQWAIYLVEQSVASGRIAPIGYFGTPPRADAVPSPAVFPWRIQRVIPGSPAQQAGMKPGDIITHLNGVEIAAGNADRLFASFAFPRLAYDPQTGQAIPQDRTITYRRAQEKPVSVTLKAGTYSPESAFGVMRTAEGKWDCMLDRENKIGYIRLGAIETGLNDRVADMMASLSEQHCRALILDLRWCPGGYVDPGLKIAGLFLPPGAVVTKLDYPSPRAGTSGDMRAPAGAGAGKYRDLPLVLLVGHETVGGGELIASALRDNNRGVVVGQRSVGRASIQSTSDTGFGGVQFRFTTGTSFRPNGKNRQRKPDSQPTDDWGIRPDAGLEVPITLEKSRELGRQAELHALRPAESREALPFDDPDADPYRLAALLYLRKMLGPPK